MKYTSGCLLVFLRSWGHSYAPVLPLTSSRLSFSSFISFNKILSRNNNINFAKTLNYDLKSRTYSVTKNILLAAKEGDGDDFFDDYDEFIANFNVEDQPDIYSPNNSVGDENNNRGGNSYNNNRGGNSYDNNRGGNNYSSNRGGNSYSNNRGGGKKDNFSHDYSRSPDDDVSNDSPDFASTISDLIAERLEYRKTGQFQDADAIRDELKAAHGVTVWDRERTWTTARQSSPPRQRGGNDRFSDRKPRRQDRDFGPLGHDYELDSGTQGVSKEEMDKLLPEVNSLIAERLQCKLSRDFQTADAIQEDLRTNYKVDVHDGFKSFRFMGDGEGDWANSSRQGDNRQQQGRRDFQVRQYNMRGTLSESDNLDVELVQGLVQKRAIAKSERDYDVADRIRDELKNKYDIVVDDRSGEWSLSTKQYLMVGSSGNVSNKIIEEIQLALAERMDAKKCGDYETADDIRDDLNAKYGVSIYDNSKEFEIEYTGEPDVVDNAEESISHADADDEAIDTDAGADDEDIIDTDEDNSNEDVDIDADITSEDVDTDAGGSEEVSELDRETLEALTVPQLKEKLRELSLPVSGRKSELVDRILGVE